jgi:glutathione synthase
MPFKTRPPLNIACQMDHITTLSLKGDSSFAMLYEAQKRGHVLYHYTPDSLSQEGSRVWARAEPITLALDKRHSYRLGEQQKLDLADMDVILMRQDPPFDMAYITATHILESLSDRVLIVNDPKGVRNAPEKILVLQFADLMPPTLVTRDMQAIKDFRAEHGDIVIKPLYGNGGKGVFRLRPEDENFGALVDLYRQIYREPFMVQRYLPEIRKGDKRILLVDGKVAGAINRIPADHDLRSNLVQGGRAEAYELNARDHEICERLGPVLRDYGCLFTGIDVIGDYLTEINVTSPTGIVALRNLGGPDVAELILDAIEDRF